MLHHLSSGALDIDRAARCYDAVLAAGGLDNGPPGLRPDYGEHYYAAFVVDPEGYRLEAVCKAEE